jgi:6-phosphofructokinase 1
MVARHIAINTGGGDAPGLNAVIRAVSLAAVQRSWTVTGIRNGYLGLSDPPEGLVQLDRTAVAGITHLGGTILGANNRGSPFSRTDSSGRVHDASSQVAAEFRQCGFDALVALGGDGSLRIAQRLFEEHGIPVVGVPKTIDNDVFGTELSFGFESAVAMATEALDRLHPTAESHDRVMVVELMGRNAGWIALNAGVAGTADVVLIPEIPFHIESVCEKIRARESFGRHFSIVVVAEGAAPAEGGPVFQHGASGDRLGGIGRTVATQIESLTGKDTRELVLGHLQRGGQPVAADRLLSLRLGAAAVRAVEQEHFGTMVALQCGEIRTIPLHEGTHCRTVPLECDLIATARDLGICLGD